MKRKIIDNAIESEKRRIAEAKDEFTWLSDFTAAAKEYGLNHIEKELPYGWMFWRPRKYMVCIEYANPLGAEVAKRLAYRRARHVQKEHGYEPVVVVQMNRDINYENA